ncbi:MAG: response regulator [Salinisphaera sp.]|uniref:response regulator transcription factor n=1 Tax=Salinisphaera sp. TaxID=1914330 RepID=UPI003C7A77D0
MDIVVVEDDASMRHAMQRMLQASGCLVTSYESAEFLLEIGIDQARRCDCLVLDIRLPGISGLDLCRTLLAGGACPPCILITGHDTPGLRDLATRAGARDYLLKPFTGTTLLDAIGRAVAA